MRKRRPIVDISNKKFGRLTAIRHCGYNQFNQALWYCVCECGGEVITAYSHLKSGHTKSCGCLIKEKAREKCLEQNPTHRLTKSPLYRIWIMMRQRCYCPRNEYEKELYKDRGITVCDEWLNNFQAFYEWSIANGWADERLPSGKHKLTIDRIDNDEGYSPDNCRWVDMKVQSNNKRPNRKNANIKEKIARTIHYENGIAVKKCVEL